MCSDSSRRHRELIKIYLSGSWSLSQTVSLPDYQFSALYATISDPEFYRQWRRDATSLCLSIPSPIHLRICQAGQIADGWFLCLTESWVYRSAPQFSELLKLVTHSAFLYPAKFKFTPDREIPRARLEDTNTISTISALLAYNALTLNHIKSM